MWWWAAACGFGGGGAADSDTTDPNDTIAPGEIEPTPACVEYLACLEAAGSPYFELEQQVYGPGGECWVSASAALACTELCTAGIEAQRLETPEVAECWVGEVLPTAAVFADVDTNWVITEASGSDPNCDLFLGFAVAVEGAATQEFVLRVSGELYGQSVDTAVDCELAEDLTFDCPGSPAAGTWSGSFPPAFARVNLGLDASQGDTTFTCAFTGTRA